VPGRLGAPAVRHPAHRRPLPAGEAAARRAGVADLSVGVVPRGGARHGRGQAGPRRPHVLMAPPKEFPIKLGSILFTMVEPHKGHEVEYNRWYERDHFYAGCMVGTWTFAGQRFVATRPYKDLRVPQSATPITPDASIGSYLALYWILKDHHDEWNRWGGDQVNWLHANGRQF